MRRLILIILLVSVSAFAQTAVKFNYDWPAVSTTGQLGVYLSQVAEGNPLGASNFTIDFAVTGTAPGSCTFRVEGSSDGVAWTGLDATAPAVDAAPCTTSNMLHITQKPVRFVRVYIVAYASGDATSKVIFHYSRGSM